MPDPVHVWRAVWVTGAGLRIWDMRGAENIAMHNVTLPEGADALDGLDTLTSDSDDARPTVVCGYVGVKPSPVPCPPLATPLRRETIIATPMLRQQEPPVISGGAEIAIAGYLEAHPKFDGVIVTVAEQTLWSHISAGEVVSMMAFETPRLAAALNASYRPGPAFDAALSDTQTRPERIAAHLAQARTGGSGQELAHLIGAEIAAARPYWLGQLVTVLADDSAGEPYAAALRTQGAMIESAALTPYFLAGCATIVNG